MQYQLILQFDEYLLSYDDMIELENKLERRLEGLAEVDGHDIGSGEINYFIFTDNPKSHFAHLQTDVIDPELQKNLRAAYRKIEEEVFYVLWPKGLSVFKVA